VSTEKLAEYYQHLLKTQQQNIGTYAAKARNLRRSIRKLQKQVSSGNQNADSLHIIDYDQLKIENHQFLEKIAEKNQELLRLKLTTGNTLLVLSSLKSQLARVLEERRWIEGEIQARHDQTDKLDQSIALGHKQLNQLQGQLSALRFRERSVTSEDQVVDYIGLTALEAHLERVVKEWRRKVEITERMHRQRTGYVDRDE
ncbi:hypothetical protein KIPB_010248, partial [Kipferlia bialata]